MPPLRKRNVQGPSGGAGLIRYFDVDEGGPKLNPKLVVGVTIAVVILEIISSIVLS
ncbi:MAG: preprotein translocase subunit Sec61beta [Candidatus Altiarchaeota archaeon]